MKNSSLRLAASAAVFLLGIVSKAQTIINHGIVNNLQVVAVEAMVKDAETSEPVDFASAYITKQNDTTMCSFGLTNQGKIRFDKIQKGKYTIYVEMMGYEAFARNFSIATDIMDVYNIGTIMLKPSRDMLDAAKVVDAADAVRVRKDTVIFNAASYKVGSDSRLGALLSKMPGIEIDGSGISFNGEKITKLTVGGRTFFMNDPGVAVATIPAKIVQNIKIFDDEEASAGLSAKREKRKAMDVTLKKEYRKGMFGDILAAAGAEKNPVVNGQAFVASYGEKDMLTGVGALNMVADPFNGTTLMYRSGIQLKSYNATRSGKDQSGLAGVNFNHIGKKRIETNCYVVYDYSKKDISDTTLRRTASGSGFLERTERYTGESEVNTVTGRIDLKKMNPGKSMIQANAEVGYGKTYDGGVTVSEGMTTSNYAKENTLRAQTFAMATLFNLVGKAGRMACVNACASAEHRDGDGVDASMLYDSKRNYYDLSARGFYCEPLSGKLAFQVDLSGNLSGDKFDRSSEYNAYDNSNDNRLLLLSEEAKMEYSLNSLTMFAGVVASEYKNDETWQHDVSPIFSLEKNGRRGKMSLTYSNVVSRPDRASLMPVLNMNYSNVVFIGNPVLECSVQHDYAADLRTGLKNGGFLAFHAGGFITENSKLNTTWYNDRGQRFIVPENADKSSFGNSARLTFYSPIGKQKKLSTTVNVRANFSRTEGRVAKDLINDVDVDNFDYAEFQNWFSTTDAFVSSRQSSSGIGMNPCLKWDDGKLSLTAEYELEWIRNRWKNNSGFDEDIFKNEVKFSGLYKTDKDWEFELNYRCGFINGELYDFAKDEHNLGLRISKGFKRCTLSLRAINLLDCKSAYDVYSTPSVQENVMSVRYGRTILAAVSFNFGKISPMQSKKARGAANSLIMH